MGEHVTTTDPAAELATIDDEDQGDDVAEAEVTDVREFIDAIATMARENAGQPVPMAQGTFALYPMEDGGAMFVTGVDQGPMAGVKHTRIPPGMIRAVSVLAAGGSKASAMKALMGFGKRERKALPSGE